MSKCDRKKIPDVIVIHNYNFKLNVLFTRCLLIDYLEPPKISVHCFGFILKHSNRKCILFLDTRCWGLVSEPNILPPPSPAFLSLAKY